MFRQWWTSRLIKRIDGFCTLKRHGINPEADISRRFISSKFVRVLMQNVGWRGETDQRKSEKFFRTFGTFSPRCQICIEMEQGDVKTLFSLLKITVTRIWFEIDTPPVCVLLTYFFRICSDRRVYLYYTCIIFILQSCNSLHRQRRVNKCPLFDPFSQISPRLPEHLANFFRDLFFFLSPLYLAIPRRSVPSPFHLSGSHTTNKGKFRGRWRFFFDSTLFFVRRISLASPFNPPPACRRFTTAEYVLRRRNSKKVFFLRGFSRVQRKGERSAPLFSRGGEPALLKLFSRILGNFQESVNRFLIPADDRCGLSLIFAAIQIRARLLLKLIG